MKPWQVKSWCVPEVSAEYVFRMEDVLDLYEEAYDEAYPVVCFDEKPIQLIEDVFQPIPPSPGKARKVDYSYKRNGTCNLFVFLQPLAGWRQMTITNRRTREDFALCMKALVDEYFPRATKIRIVMDNLNTHSLSSLYLVYPPEEARRIAKKLEIHYTPKHASWLNMAEIELSVLGQQCLNRRIGTQELLCKETAAFVQARNGRQSKISWGFFTKDARKKMRHVYM